MKWVLSYATIGLVLHAVGTSAQEPPERQRKAELTKAAYLVTGLH